MKPSRSSLLTILVALVLFLGTAAVAFALNEPPSGTSQTNPNAGSAYWRQGWGNSLWPEISLTTPGDATGFMYTLDRLPSAVLATTDPDVDISVQQGGTLVNHVFALPHVYDTLPDYKRDWVPVPGKSIHDPLEGMWYIHMRFYNESNVATTTWNVPIGIDITPPRPVVFSVAPPAWTPVGNNGVTESTRRVVTWVREEHDDLSGDAPLPGYIGTGMYLFVNENEISFPDTPTVPSRTTIEDLRPGRNTIGLWVQDRATNRSKVMTVTTIVDPDTPKVWITAPRYVQYWSGLPTFNAAASDAAGIAAAYMKVDGVTWRSLNKPPYSLTVDTRKLSAGRHVLTVEVKDLFGHRAWANKEFYVDNSAIRFSSVSDSPDPFYPIIQDGYKDTNSIKAYMNEAATDLYLQIFDASGAKIREVHYANVSAGWKSLGWNGKVASSVVAPGTYYYRLVARDRAGNWTNGAKYPTTIRNYEVIYLGPGVVKVVPR